MMILFTYSSWAFSLQSADYELHLKSRLAVQPCPAWTLRMLHLRFEFACRLWHIVPSTSWMPFPTWAFEQCKLSFVAWLVDNLVNDCWLWLNLSTMENFMRFHYHNVKCIYQALEYRCDRRAVCATLSCFY